MKKKKDKNKLQKLTGVRSNTPQNIIIPNRRKQDDKNKCRERVDDDVG